MPKGPAMAVHKDKSPFGGCFDWWFYKKVDKRGVVVGSTMTSAGIPMGTGDLTAGHVPIDGLYAPGHGPYARP